MGTLDRLGLTAKVEARPVHVLVVDDDPHHLERVRSHLEPCGFRVSTAMTAKDGVEAALKGPVDLLLLDLVLPDLSGIEVVEKLRADEGSFQVDEPIRETNRAFGSRK